MGAKSSENKPTKGKERCHYYHARAAESGVTVVSSSGSTAYYGLIMGDGRGHGKEIDADQTDREQRPHQAADQTFDLLFSM